ncbi:TasA family protein [Halobacteriales archaeon Cl-PHB]
MSDTQITVTRRRLLGAVATVGVGGAGAGAGTTALFSDSETSSNTVQAGTLDLTLDSRNSSVTLLSESNVAPGASGSDSVTLANAGSVTGYVDVEVVSTTNYENGCKGNEKKADDKNTSCDDPGIGQGELQEYLEVRASLGTQDLWEGKWLTPVEIYNNDQYGTTYDLDYALSGGSSADFVLEWRLECPNSCDIVQSDSFEFTVQFSLDQQTDPGG